MEPGPPYSLPAMHSPEEQEVPHAVQLRGSWFRSLHNPLQQRPVTVWSAVQPTPTPNRQVSPVEPIGHVRGLQV